MNSIVIQSRSGPDGKLHLEIPVDQPDADFEVEIVVRPKGSANRQDHLDFLRQTAGAWLGDFERPSQLPLEERDPL